MNIPQNTSSKPITPDSTFNALIAYLHSLAGASEEELSCNAELKKVSKRPTAKYLCENVAAIASSFNCTAYANGYAVYTTDVAITVIWIPDCLSYSYQFAHLERNELEYLSDHLDLSAEFLGNLPWHITVALRGEDQAEQRLLHRKGDRKGSRSLVQDGKEVSDTEQNPDREPRVITSGSYYENPEEALIRRETIREFSGLLSERQKQCFGKRYLDGYTLEEIAEEMKISVTAVHNYLSAAMSKARNYVASMEN